MINKSIWIAVVAILLLAPQLIVTVNEAAGQAQSVGWTEPVNLSNSGAGSDPRLVAASNGWVQVFWWDRFDGMMTATYNGRAWSAPSISPLDVAAGRMPEFVLDTAGRVHAFWQKEGPGSNLWHTSMSLGNWIWLPAEVIAESALGFEVNALDDGAVVVAYMRIVQDNNYPAGMMIRRLEPGTFVWNNAIALHSSAYYRLETPATAWLYMTETGENIDILWHEPQTGTFLLASSTNGGWIWSAAQTLAAPDPAMGQPRSMYWGGRRLFAWQQAGEGCAIIQQTVDSAWVTGITGLSACPQGEAVWEAGGQLFWLWGQGGEELTLAAWDGVEWTQPLVLSFEFADPASGAQRSLSALRAVQASENVYVAGGDLTGEIWLLQHTVSEFSFDARPAPVWGSPQVLSNSTVTASEPAMAVDLAGNFHLVWLERAGDGAADTIQYATGNGGPMSAGVALSSLSTGEFIRQPVLLADAQGWLHLAWSGGSRGEIFYSRAMISAAGDPAAWSTVQVVSNGSAAWPQLAYDLAGRLYLMYIVQYNEARGVYLVHSSDGGVSWSQAELIFDAAGAGWQGIGAAALAVEPGAGGEQTTVLHAAWVEEALPGTQPSQGLYYAQATTSLAELEPLTWSEPQVMAGELANWPRLVLAEDELHLLYTVGESGVWERRMPVSAASDWSAAVRILGGEGYSLTGDSLYTHAGGGGREIHLVSVSDVGQLIYAHWHAGRWEAIELVDAASQALGTVNGAAAGSPPTGGVLGVAWTSGDANGVTSLIWTTRLIPEVEPMLQATIAPVMTLEPTLASEALPTIVPSPTPDLNQAPSGGTSSWMPLVIGAGISALLVMGWMLLRLRSRR